MNTDGIIGRARRDCRMLEVTTEQLSLIADATAEKRFPEAQAFRRENPKADAAVIAWAKEDMERDGYCSMQRYMEALRNQRFARSLFVHRLDAVYLVNHNIRSAYERLLMGEYPELVFHVRKSGCDTGATNATPVVSICLSCQWRRGCDKNPGASKRMTSCADYGVKR